MQLEFTQEYWINLLIEFLGEPRKQIEAWVLNADEIMRERAKNTNFANLKEYQAYYESKELLCGYIRWHFALAPDKRKKVTDLIKPNSYILDHGCGIASQTYRAVVEKNCKADIFDISQLITAFNYFVIYKHHLEDRIKIIDWIFFIDKYMPSEKEKYDYILSLDVLEHLEDAGFELAELSNFLKKDGKIIARAPFNLIEDKSHLECNYNKNLEDMLKEYIGESRYIIVEV